MADPDWSDPCAVLEWLRPQYYQVAAGQQVVRVTYAGRDTQFSQANVDKLAALMAELTSACAKKQGLTTGRRRAFRAG